MRANNLPRARADKVGDFLAARQEGRQERAGDALNFYPKLKATITSTGFKGEPLANTIGLITWASAIWIRRLIATVPVVWTASGEE